MVSSKLSKRKTFDLRLTKFELLHLRDVMSISSPTDLQKTISQLLSETEGRILVESMLWQKISNLCEAAQIPLGDDAPDFVVAPSTPPPIGVFRVASDPEGEEQSEGPFEFVSGDSEEDEEEDEDG